jgi:hypothetical protein
MFWDKSDQAQDCFEIAEELFAANHFPEWKGTRGFYPDELAWNSAIALMGFEPEINPPNPIWFVHPKTGLPDFRILPPEKYFMGLYGDAGTCHIHAWSWYNQQMTFIGIAQKCKVFRVSSGEKAQADRSIRKYLGIRPETKNEGVYEKIEKYRTA